jgi:hypothetical protein
MRGSVLVFLLVAGCGPGYELEFTCGDRQGPDCPDVDKECPTLPLGSGGCEDVPSLFGHPVIHVDVGRPKGCVAHLPYGNPYYSDTQEDCYCQPQGYDKQLAWMCGL